MTCELRRGFLASSLAFRIVRQCSSELVGRKGLQCELGPVLWQVAQLSGHQLLWLWTLFPARIVTRASFLTLSINFPGYHVFNRSTYCRFAHRCPRLVSRHCAVPIFNILERVAGTIGSNF